MILDSTKNVKSKLNQQTDILVANVLKVVKIKSSVFESRLASVLRSSLYIYLPHIACLH